MKGIRYLTVGITAFLLDFAVFNIGVCVIKNEEFANTLAMLIGFVYSFILNRRWTFKSKRTPLKQFLLSGVLLFVNIIISNFAIKYAVVILNMEEYLIKLFVQVIIVVWNYIIYDKLILK